MGDDGLQGELIAAVRERYGFEYPTDSLDDWVRELVAVLALTETYIGYGEPAEFPFMTRLPPLGLRPHHLQLLQRWLRDSEGRGAWDRWILEVEHKLDLTAWAQGRPGCSFGFPHLVRLRWDEVRQAFDAAASKSSAVDTFFQDNGDLIQRECEYAKASSAPVGAWSLLRDLGTFLGACGQARSRAEQATGAAALARVYVEAADSVERQHVRLRARAEEEGLPAVTRVLDRCYGAYANVLNNRFFKSIADAASVAIPGIPPVTSRLGEDAVVREGQACGRHRRCPALRLRARPARCAARARGRGRAPGGDPTHRHRGRHDRPPAPGQGSGDARHGRATRCNRWSMARTPRCAPIAWIG